MEMSFATQEDVFAVCEELLPYIFGKYRMMNAPCTVIEKQLREVHIKIRD